MIPALPFALLIPGVALLVGLVVVVMVNQKDRDKQLKLYEIHFPSTLDPKNVLAWIDKVTGWKQPKWRWQALPTIVFETHVVGSDISYWLRVTPDDYRYIGQQLTTLVPGTSVELVESEERINWTAAVEYGESNKHLPLNIVSVESVGASIIRAMQTHKDEHEMLLQVVIGPMAPTAPPPKDKPTRTYTNTQKRLYGIVEAPRDEVDARRAKLSEKNVMAAIRVAAKAPDAATAHQMLKDVGRSIKSTSRHHNDMKQRTSGPKVIEAIKGGRTPFSFPSQLTATELLAFTGWMAGTFALAGMPTGRTRQLPASNAVSRSGIVVGHSTFSDDRRPLALTVPGMTMHTYVSGPTGCLHPDTPVFDPVNQTTKSVKERWEEGKPFHVFALDGERLVVTVASPPVRYHRVGMYELYNDNHTIVVTGQHRIWNGERYVEVEQLYQHQLESGAVRLPSISERGLSRLREDAQSLMHRGASSRDDCRWYCRSRGQQLRQEEGTYQGPFPSQDDAPEPGSHDLGEDDRARTQVHSPSCLPADQSSKSGSFHPSSLVRDSQHRAGSSTGVRFCSSCRAACISEDRSVQIYTAEQSQVPGLLESSHHDDSISQCSHDDSDPSRHNMSCASSASLRKLCGHHELAEESSQSSLGGASSPDLLFNDYSKYDTFMVRPARAETYYDFHVPVYENYLACGLIHHNSGKTVAMANIFHQHIAQGLGGAIIETKGEPKDLYHKMLNYIPRERLKDVIVVDVQDSDFPVGFNALQQGNPEDIAQRMQSLFDAIYGSGGVLMPAALYHGLMVLMTTTNSPVPLTFADLSILYAPMSNAERDYADHLTRGVPDVEIRRWWQQVENMSLDKRNALFNPLNQRAWQLNGRPAIRNILGQSQSSFDIGQAIHDRKIVLFNLAGLGSQVRSLLGSIFIDAIWGAMKAGAGSEETPFLLCLDEFQNYPTLGVDFPELAAEARAFGLSMLLANQNPMQLKHEVMTQIMGNVRNTFVYQSDSKSAMMFAGEFGRTVSPDDFVQLGKYEAIARVMGSNGRSEPFTVSMLPPLKAPNLGNAVRAASRRAHGRPRHQVEEELQARRQMATKKKRNVRFGEENI